MAPQPLSAFAARLAPAVLGFGIAVAGVAPSLAQERSLGQLFEPELSTPTADGARRFWMPLGRHVRKGSVPERSSPSS